MTIEKKRDDEKKTAGAPKKIAIVAAGRSVYTNRGVAYSPAHITAEMLPGGQSEFRKLLNGGAIKYPEKPKMVNGEQLSIDGALANKPGEPGEPGEPVEPGEPPASKVGGAKRK